MEFLKVLVVLLVVLQGSLSKPVNSENELHVIVGKLERLAESLRRYVVDESRSEYSMGGKEPLSVSMSEFPILGSRPLGLWGLDNDDLDPSSPTYKWLYKMSEKLEPSSPTYKWLYKMPGKLVKPYFRSFPTGPYSSEMPLTPRDIVTMLNVWYNHADQKMLGEQTFFNVARQLLDARFQCATTRINQIVFYVFIHHVRTMAENDQKMATHVRKVLGNWVTDTAVMDKVTQTIIQVAHRHAYGDIMKDIEYFQLKDIVEFIAKMKMIMGKAEQEKWTPVVFNEKLDQLLTDYGFVFQCPSEQDLWEFHQNIVSRFQERLSKIQPFAETEAWLKNLLPMHMSTDATPAITSILQVYTDYVKSAMLHLQEVENHVTSENTAEITNVMSQFLEPHQLQYLQSILEFLDSGNIGDIPEMKQIRNENTVIGRPTSSRCTESHEEC